jgi:HAE1 family hydrophobic/amphiphilic exporter-1
VADAADALRLHQQKPAGDQVTTFNQLGEQYESASSRRRRRTWIEEAIAALPEHSARLGIVTLDNIATFASSDSPATIGRMGRQRQVTLSAVHAAGHLTGQRPGGGRAAAAELNFGPEYRGDFAGRSPEVESHGHRVPERDRAVRSSSICI